MANFDEDMVSLLLISSVLALSSCLPLYDSEQPFDNVPPLSIEPTLYQGAIPPSLPIDFVASGSECLGPIPVYALRVPPIESSDARSLAKRLAPLMASYSAQTQMESCARFCKAPTGQIQAQLVTIGSQVSCVASANTCPANSTPLAYTIHSHPPAESIVINRIDAVGWNEEKAVGKAHFKGEQNEFSPPDRLNLPAFLVGENGNLYFLDGAHAQPERIK